MRQIGLSFGDELRAADLQDGVGWSDTEITACPPEKRAAVAAILAAHDPGATPQNEKSDVKKLAELLVQERLLTAQQAEAIR